MNTTGPALKKLLLLCVPAMAILAQTKVASAQPQPVQQCPPGSWFCEGTPQQPAQPPPQGAQPLQPLPGSSSMGSQPQGQPPIVTYQQTPPAPPVNVQTPAPPPVVVYQPAPPPVVVVQPHPPTPMYVYTAPQPVRRLWRPEWGINLRLEGALFGTGYKGDVAGIGGLGLGLRYRPSPWVAIEGDVDFLGGRDYNNYRRGETAFSVNALLFVNPRDRVQFYFLAGLGGSIAHVVDDSSPYGERGYDWGYFGAQGGGGLEFRLARTFALHADLRGFIRGRTDSMSRWQPEFTDPQTGKTTNTSGGVLVTGGMTFYF